MQVSEVEDLRAKLHDSEESANRFIKERDELSSQVSYFKKVAREASAHNPEVKELRKIIENLQENARLDNMEKGTMRLEMQILRKTVRLLRQKNAMT